LRHHSGLGRGLVIILTELSQLLLIAKAHLQNKIYMWVLKKRNCWCWWTAAKYIRKWRHKRGNVRRMQYCGAFVQPLLQWKKQVLHSLSVCL